MKLYEECRTSGRVENFVTHVAEQLQKSQRRFVPCVRSFAADKTQPCNKSILHTKSSAGPKKLCCCLFCIQMTESGHGQFATVKSIMSVHATHTIGWA